MGGRQLSKNPKAERKKRNDQGARGVRDHQLLPRTVRRNEGLMVLDQQSRRPHIRDQPIPSENSCFIMSPVGLMSNPIPILSLFFYLPFPTHPVRTRSPGHSSMEEPVGILAASAGSADRFRDPLELVGVPSHSSAWTRVDPRGRGHIVRGKSGTLRKHHVEVEFAASDCRGKMRKVVFQELPGTFTLPCW